MSKQNEQTRLEELMAAYQEGDLAAFDSLFTLLKPRLYPYLVSRCLSAAIAEDLLQETFLQIHRSRHTYLPGKPVLPWAFGVARHVVLMDRRARMRRERTVASSDGKLADCPVPPEIGAIFTAESVQEALRELPDDHREPLLLHHLWGFAFKEIGRILGIRGGTAKVRAHRGMVRLREILGSARNPDGSAGKQ